MMKPLYNYDFDLKLTGTGENEQEAWDTALSGLIEEVSCGKGVEVPDFKKYAEPVVDTVTLDCSLCHESEEVRDDNMGDWMPEIYLGDVNLGCCCPTCQEEICDFEEDPVVNLSRVKDLNDYPGLREQIMMACTHKKSCSNKMMDIKGE